MRPVSPVRSILDPIRYVLTAGLSVDRAGQSVAQRRFEQAPARYRRRHSAFSFTGVDQTRTPT
jgi:hypothetical protein